MKLHELKILADYWNAIIDGSKTFELRKNDRDYQVGDLINFNLIEDTLKSTNEIFEITYVLKDVPEYGLDKDYCILGLKKLDGHTNDEYVIDYCKEQYCKCEILKENK